MVILYGISNCDTVRKARKWLESESISYQFHDFRKDGLEKDQVAGWLETMGWERLVNKRSTSWKALDETERKAMDNEKALCAILDAPTLIKRPLLDHDGQLRVGFKAEEYSEIFGV